VDPEELARIVAELHETTRTIEGLRGRVTEALEGLDTRIATALEEQLKPHLEKQKALQRQVDEATLAARRPALAEGRDASPALSPEQRTERTGGFGSFGEFIRAIRFQPNDARLAPLQERALSMGVGAAGGFLVPTEFVEMLTAIPPQDAIVRPRAQVIPAGDAPDASVNIPADDQSGAKGVYSGVQVVWTGEGALKTETEPAIRQLELAPKEVSAYVDMTDKLLRNAAAAGPYVQNKLRAAILAAEDVAFISGSGVAQPLGFLGHASNVNVVRAGGLGVAAIGYADIVAMYAALLKRCGRPVWIGNPTILPQLMIMPSALGQLIWMPSAREGVPSTLIGIPFLENERQPVLGTAGDLMLVNLLYYVIKDGAAMTIEASQHVKFLENRTIIRAVWNVDGQPTLSSPLLLEDGTSTQSPFVVLN